MTNDSDMVSRIRAILSRPADPARNVELSELLERAILSEDDETRTFATKVWMSIGAATLPVFVCCDGDESLINAAVGTIDLDEIEDSSEELFATIGLTPDDAAELIKKVLQLREEARLKSRFYGENREER